MDMMKKISLFLGEQTTVDPKQRQAMTRVYRNALADHIEAFVDDYAKNRNEDVLENKLEAYIKRFLAILDDELGKGAILPKDAAMAFIFGIEDGLKKRVQKYDAQDFQGVKRHSKTVGSVHPLESLVKDIIIRISEREHGKHTMIKLAWNNLFYDKWINDIENPSDIDVSRYFDQNKD